eukprot:CAMPEP_0114530912 /NCGR_PEP_ID=MMETSP0109-20121206/25725_1 /TAXON_ID=29199 /ORGANISM="Chlorarachnion reptans, Strain CCCM449" /LENGTH=274 /DNA_ID=CAMNT_0001713621 /DNA_START=524 /DNA_END=1348 /DNA_ORIENTATION=+
MIIHRRRPHVCQTCGKRFSRKSNLRNHQKTHGLGKDIPSQPPSSQSGFGSHDETADARTIMGEENLETNQDFPKMLPPNLNQNVSLRQDRGKKIVFKENQVAEDEIKVPKSDIQTSAGRRITRKRTHSTLHRDTACAQCRRCKLPCQGVPCKRCKILNIKCEIGKEIQADGSTNGRTLSLKDTRNSGLKAKSSESQPGGGETLKRCYRNRRCVRGYKHTGHCSENITKAKKKKRPSRYTKKKRSSTRSNNKAKGSSKDVAIDVDNGGSDAPPPI